MGLRLLRGQPVAGNRTHAGRRGQRYQNANSSSVYRAASKSSNITPKPLFSFASKWRIGGGLTMSKNRNATKAANCAANPAGTNSSTSQNATISAQTIEP